MERLLDQRLYGSLWNKLIRRECTQGIKFREDVTYMEDLLFVMKILWKDRNMRISYLPKAFYHYVQNSSSILNTLSPRVVLTGKKVIEWLEEQLGMKEDWIYIIKVQTLGDLFRNDGLDYLLVTYPEVHRRYIREHRRFHIFAPWGSCLAIALRGYPRAAYRLCQLCLGLVRVKESIR